MSTFKWQVLIIYYIIFLVLKKDSLQILTLSLNFEFRTLNFEPAAMSQQWISEWKNASAEPAPTQAMSRAAGPKREEETEVLGGWGEG